MLLYDSACSIERQKQHCTAKAKLNIMKIGSILDVIEIV